jgi:hypothetical protein
MELGLEITSFTDYDQIDRFDGDEISYFNEIASDEIRK